MSLNNPISLFWFAGHCESSCVVSWLILQAFLVTLNRFLCLMQHQLMISKSLKSGWNGNIQKHREPGGCSSGKLPVLKSQEWEILFFFLPRGGAVQILCICHVSWNMEHAHPWFFHVQNWVSTLITVARTCLGKLPYLTTLMPLISNTPVCGLVPGMSFSPSRAPWIDLFRAC